MWAFLFYLEIFNLKIGAKNKFKLIKNFIKIVSKN